MVRWEKLSYRSKRLSDDILSFWIGGIQRSAMLIDSQTFLSISHRMFVSSDTEVGEEFRELKLAQDKVISLWTCHIPVSPRSCSSGRSLSLSFFPGILVHRWLGMILPCVYL